MNNISTIMDCYGCGVCATICPKRIISINLNEDGFYQPEIKDLEKCVNCGLCLEVCSYSHDELSLKNPQIHSYGAWSKDNTVRKKCSSGGIGFEIGRTLLNKGYMVCAVRYNAEKQYAEHYIADTVENLIPSIGSKYIQSYSVEGFKAVNRKEKYLVTGTPCQIDSFRRLIQKWKVEDNFILMDFFCHGVPSMWVWKKYLKHVETMIGPITYVSWRNKFTGWYDSWAMSIDGESGRNINRSDSYDALMQERKGVYNSRLSQGDMFYNLFLSDSCLGKACYDKCKFKYDHSSADIRIGDMWGSIYKNNKEGVSTAISFTENGHQLLKSINCELHTHPFELVAEGQMKTMPKRLGCYDKVMSLLKDDRTSIIQVNKTILQYRKKQKIKEMIFHPIQAINYIIKRVSK